MARVTNQDLQVQLTEMKVLLTNHLHHHEMDFNRWTKVYIPILLTCTSIMSPLVLKLLARLF